MELSLLQLMFIQCEAGIKYSHNNDLLKFIGLALLLLLDVGLNPFEEDETKNSLLWKTNVVLEETRYQLINFSLDYNVKRYWSSIPLLGKEIMTKVQTLQEKMRESLSVSILPHVLNNIIFHYVWV